MIKDIKILIVDCDGCLTDGKFYYSSEGKIMKVFNARDGIGLIQVMNAGISAGIISGDNNGKIIHARSNDLNLNFCFTGIKNKFAKVEKILKENKLKWNNVCYIGDDINDHECMINSGLTFCPSNSHEKILSISNIICKKNGGEGCVREACDYIVQLTERKNEKSEEK